MAEDSYEERTEEPTQQRRDEWKKEGRVAQSKELTGALMLLGISATLWGASKWTIGGIWNLFQSTLGDLAKLGRAEWSPELVISILSSLATTALYVLAPVAGIAVTIAIAASIVQTGFVWSTKPLEMNLDKLNPLNGLGRIFSADGLVEMFKAIAKFLLIGTVVYFFLKKRVSEAGGLWNVEPATISLYLGQNMLSSLMIVAFSMFLIAGLDYAFQRFRFEQKIRMTKQEIREERKQSEGNPQIKARIRGLQRRVATNKMLEAVKSADVVVTNPTHIAVALVYDRDMMNSPRVVAKGADFMAEKIKKIARENGIPCVENVPLARAMYKALKIGQFISRDLYNAVAEVLAYVYRLKGKTSV